MSAGPQAGLGWWSLEFLGSPAMVPCCIWKGSLFTGWRDVYREGFRKLVKARQQDQSQKGQHPATLGIWAVGME